LTERIITGVGGVARPFLAQIVILILLHLLLEDFGKHGGGAAFLMDSPCRRAPPAWPHSFIPLPFRVSPCAIPGIMRPGCSRTDVSVWPIMVANL